jgi:protein-S-isoprenylcysteine O-methyltransferase Ste14
MGAIDFAGALSHDRSMRALYWPGLGIGVIVAVYWGRVLHLAAKARRQDGHGAHFVPPERLGRVLRLIWFPVVGLWVAIPLLVGLGARLPGRALWALVYFNYPVAAIGVVVAAAALAATLICWKRMGRDWRMGIDPNERTRLIITGPYAYVRHPIYALSQLMMLGSVVAVPAPAMGALALLHIGLLQWEARREEAHLLRVQGDEYARYMGRVGRFLPRSCTPYVPASSG